MVLEKLSVSYQINNSLSKLNEVHNTNNVYVNCSQYLKLHNTIQGKTTLA